MITIQTLETNQERVERVQKKFNIDLKLAEFFVKRGVDDKKIALLLDNALDLLPNNNIINIDIASNVIKDYINNPNAKIYIYADYDADGINSGYIAYDCISQLINIYETGCEVELKMPNRIEGYGLSLEWCNKIVKKNFKERKDILVITVDNGITKKEECSFLTANNVKVIVTDHHSPKENETPDVNSCIVIDPHLYNESYNAKGLCGAAIAYKLFSYLLDEVFGDTSGYSKIYLVNAAIATITDMMPHTEENLRIVSNGLNLLNNNYCCDSLSFYKDYKKKVIKPKDIGFELGPQLNACGRMGNIDLAIKYMLSSEDDIVDLYGEMDQLNTDRKELEKKILKEVFKNDYKEHNIIIALLDDLGGLGGTVASKIANRYNKPVIVLSNNKDSNIVHGSARNVGNIDLHWLFTNEANKGNIITFGGHKAASGIELDKTKLDIIQESLDNQLYELYKASGMFDEDTNSTEEEQIVYVDDVIGLAEINKKTVKPYENILFFNNFKEPQYAIKEVTIVSTRTSSNNPDNICFNMIDDTYGLSKNKYNKEVGKELWMWGFGQKYKELGSPTKVHLIGKIEPDFRNEKVLTFSIEDMIIA